MKILLVEDDPILLKAVDTLLQKRSYAVDTATDGDQASELMAINDYDLVVLDLVIPLPNGLDLLERWRQEGREVPILITTAKDAVDERVRGLDAGADDYLVKPYDLSELLARVRSLLRRRERPLASELSAGDIAMDRAAHQASFRGERLDLSPKEFALLEYLLRYQNEVVTRAQIAEHVWDSSFDSLTNLIDVYVYRLRKKLDDVHDRRLIETVKGIGYVLRASSVELES